MCIRDRYKSILKYSFVDDFAAVLGSLRKQIVLDLNDDGMRKDKVTALVIWLIDRYHIRVGSDQYAMENESYGLTTLKESHLTYIRGKKAEIPGKGEVTGRKKNELPKINAKMMFTGKSGKDWKLYIRHPEIVKLIEESGKVGGKDSVQDVFRYKDNNGKDFDIKAEHINEYLDKHMANRYTAKDFRTWAASWKTAARLAMVSNFSEEFIEKLPQEHEESVEKSKNSGLPPYIIIEQKDRPSVYLKGTEAMAKLAEAKKIPGEGEKERMATMLAVIDTVAADLGNTRAVCRSSYIRPMFMNDWESGVFLERWGKEINRAKKIGGKEEFEKMSLDEVTALLYMKKYESEEFDDALGFENV